MAEPKDFPPSRFRYALEKRDHAFYQVTLGDQHVNRKAHPQKLHELINTVSEGQCVLPEFSLGPGLQIFR